MQKRKSILTRLRALGLGRPVLFVDVPPRVRNPKYAELGLEPMVQQRGRGAVGRAR